MGMPKVWSSFSVKDFRFLWISNALANSGNWTYTVGIGWLLYSLGESSLWSGLGMFANMIPVVIFGPFTGIIADRFNRRSIYSFALWLGTAIVTALFIVYMSGFHSLWFVIACSFGLGITSSIQMVSSQSMVPLIISKDKLYNASALLGVVSHGAAFFGAALATPLLAQAGVEAVLGLCVLLYASAALCSVRIRLPGHRVSPTTAGNRSSYLRPLADGFAYIRMRPIGLIIVVVGLHCALTMSFNGLLPAFSIHHLSASGSGTYGGLMTFVGLGAIIGNLMTAGISGKRSLARLYVATALGSGALLGFLAVVHGSAAPMILAAGIGGTQSVFMATSMALIMQRTDQEFQGRVSSVYYLIASGLMALCNLAYGALGTLIPAAYIMMTTGFLFVILFGLIGGLSSLLCHTLQVRENLFNQHKGV